ncbi:4-hydroxy-tetrahydrodipicolinate synthase [Thalassolituus maritimus]|uniref:4-hydroxy-tetrahydrodipicolinate synthase n=1 Tax=Thalassolituus maritimus TaxID=484498 RepID=A0A1N7PTU9_9GAMM|nr:dihydrodipicolinate synthase family protein [Thalassolituus maritimus]SIT13869.1 4-hydroxy-tetrahydrodipicolinate synthase [Thalassolituus maritimus]
MTLSGIIAYPITPFTNDGRDIDFHTLGKTIELLIDNGSDAIAPLGSTGESAYLSQDEWRQVAKFSVEKVAKRVPVVVGISELTTQLATEKAMFAESIDADVIMVIPVSYWKLSDQEIQSYYRTIAESTTLPIMIYNNPATSGVDMAPELIVTMFKEIPNVTMVKESSGDIQRMHKIFELTSGQLPFFNGCNPLALEALCAGASGWCTAAPNLIGALPKQLYESVINKELSVARNLFYRQLPLLRFIVSGGLPKMVKAGLALNGIDAGSPRKPLLEANEDEIKALEILLSNI